MLCGENEILELPVRRALQTGVYLGYLNAVIQHDLVGTIRILSDGGCINIVCVSHVEIFIQLKLKQSDYRVVQAIGES